MSRCATCDSTCRVILGSGPQPCEFLFIGEKPGREEDARGKVFIGDAGRELDSTYLGLAGLERQVVRVTNTVRCRLGGTNNTPTPGQIRACASHHLPGEVSGDECNPKVIVLLGATACSLVPKIDLDKDHGYPLWVGSEDSEFFGGWEGWVVPMYHPAGGMHDTRKMTPLLEDFERMGKWWRGKWKAPEPIARERLDYKVVQTVKELWEDLNDEYYEYLPVDTERDGPTKPWSLQYSTRPGKGRLIFADRKDLLEQFAVSVAWGRTGYMLHNAPQDLDMLDAMGVGGRGVRFRDTMQEAYQLCNQPQGLKALGWRLLGVRMRSWKEVVGPPSRTKMVEWLVGQWDQASGAREKVEIKLKTKVKILYRPTQREKDLKRILSHAHKPEYKVWKQAEDAGVVGGPIPSIVHVPIAEAVEYACQDADVEGQVGQALEDARRELVRDSGKWDVPEEDWDQ